MLLNNRSMSMGKDGLSNSVGDVVPNLGSSMPGLPRPDPDMLLKVPFVNLYIVVFFIKVLISSVHLKVGQWGFLYLKCVG